MKNSLIGILLFVVGLSVIIAAKQDGDDAYFIGKNYYINIKDSVDLNYEPYLLKLAEKERRRLANLEKIQLRTKVKPLFDVLEITLLQAKRRNNNNLIDTIELKKKEAEDSVLAKEFAIDEKYLMEAMNAEDKEKLVASIRDTLDREQYLVIVANKKKNDNNLKEKQVSYDEINVQRVHLQSITPFLWSGSALMLVGLLVFLIARDIIQLEQLTVRLTIQGIVALFTLFIAYKIYDHIHGQIKFNEDYKTRGEVVKKQLNAIRKIQLAYLENNGKYCNNWKELKRFANNDSIQITKILVNQDDSAAVSQAKSQGLAMEQIIKVPVMQAVFSNENMNIDKIDIVPFSKEQFTINASIITKNDRKIPVFQVQVKEYQFVKNMRNLPENFDKEKCLQIGSLKEATTEGNW